MEESLFREEREKQLQPSDSKFPLPSVAAKIAPEAPVALESRIREERARLSIHPSPRVLWTMLCFTTLLALSFYGLAPSCARARAFGSREVATGDSLNPYPHLPRITFDRKGRFRLSVFSDLHYAEAANLEWGPQQDANSTRVMRLMLKTERPDFVAINGDLITGDNTLRSNSTKYIDVLLQPLLEAKVPFATTFGNHDNQANISHADEIVRIQKVAPRTAYTRAAPKGVGGQGGEGNYWVPVYANRFSRSPSLVIWFFDSRGGKSPGPNSTALPDWVDASVATWIESESKLMNKAWGDAKKTGRQALVFVHIPPHIMIDLQKTLDSTKEPGMNSDNPMGAGSAQSSSGEVGKDLDWWRAVHQYIPNLHATVHGHDHGNEWCKRDNTANGTGIVLCFNKHTGYGGYSHDGWGYGIRQFEFTLGKQSARTYIRMENGTTHADVTLDAKYDA